MAKKKSKACRSPKFFNSLVPNDPFGNIVAEGLNIVADHGLQRLSREAANVFGVQQGPSIEDQLSLDRSRLALRRQEDKMAKEAMLGERQLRILDLNIRQKELAMEESRRRIEDARQTVEPVQQGRTEIICGALEVVANPEGLTSSPDQSEGYAAWLASLEESKVILILGRRGSGKTALAAKIAEYIMATTGRMAYWIGLPEQARGLLPHWIRLASSLEQCPVCSTIIVDEAGLEFLSLAFNTDRNKLLRTLLMIARQRQCALIFAAQNSRDVEYSVIRQADTFVFKEPGLNQAQSERSDIRAKARRAAAAFKEMPKDERTKAAYVFDDNFEGMITSTLPSFWSEDLSHVYAHLDLAAKNSGKPTGGGFQSTVIVQETKLLEAASVERDILELKRQGIGIESIAKRLNCTTWRVRKALAGGWQDQNSENP